MKITRNFLEFLSVLLCILLSNTVYFGIINRKFVLIFFIAFIILILLHNYKISFSNIKIFFVLSLIQLIVNLLNIDIIDKSIYLVFIENTILLFGLSVIASNISIEKFFRFFVNIIIIFSISSLFFYFIAVLFPQYADIFSSNIFYNGTYYKVSPLYTWGWEWNSILKRNSGPFWEPGAFQGFINLSILFILTHINSIRYVRIKFIILLFTLLTTQSTTGFIILIIILFIYNKELLLIFSKNIIIKIIIFIGGIIFTVLLVTSDTVLQKFSNTHQSTNIRLEDTTQSLQLLMERPFRGIGTGTYKNYQELRYGIKSNSNGLLYMFYAYGSIFSIVYLVYLFSSIKDTFKCKLFGAKSLAIFLILLILHATEGLIFLPVYLILMFKFKTDCNIKCDT